MRWYLSEVTAGSKKGAFLIHAVDEDTGEALCGPTRVKSDNLTGSAPVGVKEPTCPVCLRRVRK